MRHCNRDRSSALCATICIVLGWAAGCGPRSSDTPSPDGDVLTFDAAMLEPPPDAGASDGGEDAGVPSCTASMSADGVLTNHPELTFRNLGGPLVIRTAYLTVVDRTSFHTFLMWAELENTGTEIECTPLPDLYVSFLHLYPTVAGPPGIQSGTVSSVCIWPGQRGVMFAIENDVGSSFLEGLTMIEYAGDSWAAFDTPDTSGNPLIETAELRMGEFGMVVAGRARTFVPIENVRLEFFGRNPCGLIFTSMDAYPEDFETSRVGTFDFETFSDPLEPTEIPVELFGFATYIQPE